RCVVYHPLLKHSVRVSKGNYEVGAIVACLVIKPGLVAFAELTANKQPQAGSLPGRCVKRLEQVRLGFLVDACAVVADLHPWKLGVWINAITDGNCNPAAAVTKGIRYQEIGRAHV